MATEEFTALMSRAIKGTVALGDIIHQRTEERRAQIDFVLVGGGLQLAAIEIVAGFIVLEYPLNAGKIFSRNDLIFINSNKYRQVITRRIYFIEFTAFHIFNR